MKHGQISNSPLTPPPTPLPPISCLPHYFCIAFRKCQKAVLALHFLVSICTNLQRWVGDEIAYTPYCPFSPTTLWLQEISSQAPSTWDHSWFYDLPSLGWALQEMPTSIQIFYTNAWDRIIHYIITISI